MKKVKEIVISLLSAFIFIFLSVSPAHAAIDAENKLYFNDDGKFKIVVFADCQDGSNPNSKMISFMEAALDYEKPDLVVFTGDNVLVALDSSFKTGAKKIIQPLIDRNIPYAYTYGNHDDQFGVSKEYQYDVYKSLGNCLTVDEEPSLTGFGNCALPIYYSDGSNIAFNLWIIDSNSYDSSGGYDHVHQDQLDWYLKRSREIDAQAGRKVYSLAFQHIIMPEAYELLVEDANGSKSYGGKKYRQELNEKASGYLGEFPCPPAQNGGQFDVMSKEGNVLGVVTGHDHSNSFVGTVGNIDFLQTGGMSFRSYGDENARSYRVIELNQSQPDKYTTGTVSYLDYENGALNGSASSDAGLTEYSYTAGTTFISDISFAGSMTSSTAKNSLTSNGYTLVDYNLNEGTSGQYIYLGYKTTTNYADAIKSIRFYSDSSDSDALTFLSVSNGNHVTYTRVNSQDLNNKARGKYIYGYYTKDPLAGPPISSVSFSPSAILNNYTTAATFTSPSGCANLNEGTRGDDVYMHWQSGVKGTLDTFEMRFEFEQCQKLANTYGIEEKFGNAFNQARDILFELSDCGATTATQDDVDRIASELILARLNLSFDIRYYSDGSLLLSEAKPYEHSYTIADLLPKKADNVFVGWSSDKLSNADYFSGNSYSEEADLNLNAVWMHFSRLIYPKSGSSSEFDYDGHFVYGLVPGAKGLNEYIETAEGYSYTFNKVNGFVTTGSEVCLRDIDSNALGKYSVVVFGDVNSDGRCDGEDAVIVSLISEGLLTEESVGEAALTAADCSHDGVVNSQDANQLAEAGVMLAEISQK